MSDIKHTDKQVEAVRDALAMALGDAYDCTRVWSAWGYGTMSSEDFVLVAEDDDRLQELAMAALDASGATELLEALQYALPYLEACVPNPRNGVNDDYSVDVNCVDRARAAIAKATGG